MELKIYKIIHILNPLGFPRPLKLALLISILLSFSSLYKCFSSSGLIGKSSVKETDVKVQAPPTKTNHNEQNQQEFPESEKETQIAETSEEPKAIELASLTPEGEEKVIMTVGDEDEEQGKERMPVKEDGKDEYEEGELGSMSTDELNKKFDDFIRKMKATINSESNIM